MARPADWPPAVRIRALADERGRLRIRVTPNAGRTAIDLPEDEDGHGADTSRTPAAALRIRIPQTPEDGKANAAVITLLAKALGVPKSALTLEQGLTSRNKVIQLPPPE